MHNNMNVNVSGPIQPTSTYKTKVLKGNHSFATQVTEPNMKYIIKHDFVLDGDVTIPENCILEFDGGSISGEHTITGTNTGISASLIKIFSTYVTLAGSWNVAEAYPEWFGAKGDGVTDDSNVINKTISSFNTIKLSEKDYLINSPIIVISGKHLFGTSLHSRLIKNAEFNTINYIINATGEYFSIKNISLISTNYNTDQGIYCGNCNNAVFENLYIFQCKYGIYTDNTSFWLIKFEDIEIYANSKQNFPNAQHYGYEESAGFYLKMATGGGSSISFINTWVRAAGYGYYLRNIGGLLMSEANADNIYNSFLHFTGVNGVCNICKVENIISDYLVYLGTSDIVFTMLRIGVPYPIEGSVSTYLSCNSGSHCTFIQAVFQDWNIIEGHTGNTRSPRAENGGEAIFIKCTFPTNSSVNANITARELKIDNNNITNNSPDYISNNIKLGVRKVGTTAQRPVGGLNSDTLIPGSDIGFQYYDTDLNKPIYAKSINSTTTVVTWVDATGTPV